MNGQSRKMSFVESCTNIVVGLVINIVAQRLVFPLFDIHIHWAENLTIALIFTFISLARSYLLRRAFESLRR